MMAGEKGKRMLKTYKAEIEDDNFEIILAENEDEAIKEYFELEEQGHFCFGLFELDKNFDEIKSIL